jgi:hypothetical protein
MIKINENKVIKFDTMLDKWEKKIYDPIKISEVDDSPCSK